MDIRNDIGVESKINEAEVCSSMGLQQDAIKIYEKVLAELPKPVYPPDPLTWLCIKITQPYIVSYYWAAYEGFCCGATQQLPQYKKYKIWGSRGFEAEMGILL